MLRQRKNSLNTSKYKKRRTITREQEEVLIQAFEIFDKDGNGSIDQDEFYYLMKGLGLEDNRAETQRLFEELDEDGSGVLELDEYMKLMRRIMINNRNVRYEVESIFDFFDDDGSGFLDFAKLKRKANEYCENMDDATVEDMINCADTSGDGRVSKEEFLRVMKKMKLI